MCEGAGEMLDAGAKAPPATAFVADKILTPATEFVTEEALRTLVAVPESSHMHHAADMADNPI